MDLFKWCNSVACAFGIAWAYTSYKYNWLNVGGGESALKEFWIAASGVVPYLALSVWLTAVGLVAAQDSRSSSSWHNRIYPIVFTFVLTPAVFFMADWFFHIGFPKSPV